MTDTITFQTLHIPRSEIVAAARRYAGGGVKYSFRDAWITTDARTGQKVGTVDCLRLLLLVARDVGLLPVDFDVNRGRPRMEGKKPLPRNDFMLRLLEENCEQVPKEEAQPADILLLQWPDGRYHVAMKTSCEPLPLGRMIEARDVEGVVEANVMADDWKDVSSVWRIRNVRDE